MIGEKYKNEKNDIKYVFQIKLIQFSNFEENTLACYGRQLRK